MNRKRRQGNRPLIAILAAIFLAATLGAQADYVTGYRQATGGTDFTYHSIYSHNDKSLLARANHDFAPISWETEVVPANYQGDTVSFVWLYGIDVTPDREEFELYINDQRTLTFGTPPDNVATSWQVKGNDGAKLTFNRSMIDKHGDQMGYAVLSLPTKRVIKGEPLRLKIDGVDRQSATWYMTFKRELSNEFDAYQLKTVSKNGGGLYHNVRFNLVHLGEPTQARISLDTAGRTVELTTGLNEINFAVPKVESTTQVTARLEINGRIQERTISLAPVREWTVHLVQHSHTDVGYTRPQSEILAEHLGYIDDALNHCDRTDDYPEAAQFRWTCEAAWTVREYLTSRPKEQIERLLQRIREGRIEVTGMYFNFSEVIDETSLAIQLQPIKLFKEMGIEVITAMQNDVNGIGWCMVDYYHDTGVKYLTMGQHGHRARIPFDKPTSFWWESPSGNRLLAYRSEHYMHGNTLALTSGNIDVFRNNLSEYLTDLEAKDYPMERVALQFSGYLTDNSPPSTRACDIVREWNETYEWPKLKLSLASEFLAYVEENHSDALATHRVAWPDWWTDGFGSAMNETKTARNTHGDLVATTGLMAIARGLGAELSPALLRDLTTCYDNLLFYDEHTFGADQSITDPLAENSVNQWRQKSSYVWTANQQANLLREKVLGLLQPKLQKSESGSVTVFNTLNWPRSGVAEVFIYHDVLPLDKDFRIVGSNGEQVPAQLLRSRNEGSYWALWVKDVPPLGYATLTIEVDDAPLPVVKQSTETGPTFENAHYRVTIDTEKGGIVSLVDKALDKELVDPDSPYKLGALIHEALANRTDMERLTYMNRDTVYRPLDKEMSVLYDFRIMRVEDHALWKSIYLNGKLPDYVDDGGVDIEVRLYYPTKKIELLYGMTKVGNTDPEGIYVAFPFSGADNGQLAFQVQGGVVYPGINQLEGTASDWNTVQDFAAVRGEGSQIVYASNDIPLVQFGDINTGRFYYRHRPENAHIYSWVLNNYWTTNFRASQEGELKWTYQLTSSADPSLSFASRFGAEQRVPLIASLNLGTGEGATLPSRIVLDLDTPDNLLLVSARPTADGAGILLHLRETEGDHAVVDITRLLQHPKITSVTEVNVLDEAIRVVERPLLIEHYETKFLRLGLAD